jgi:hypothetical protein
VLKRNGWTLRKKTVSQKIPANWVEIAQTDSMRISDVMQRAGVDVLINADETFVKFYPADDRVIAPEGGLIGLDQTLKKTQKWVALLWCPWSFSAHLCFLHSWCLKPTMKGD